MTGRRDLTGHAGAVIRAAGGVLSRVRPDGQCEVCLVHRPRYGDWSLPKGRVERGEHPLATAVREVAEETGIRARPLRRLPTVRYLAHGVPKVVDYWSMSVLAAGPFRAGSEVDAVAWLPAAAAAERLRYPADRALLGHWRDAPRVTGVVLLVRHAHAGARGQWHGADHDRSLSDAGTADAAALCRVLSLFAPEALISASPRRCVQTLAPLARQTGQRVEVVRSLDEDPPDPDGAVAALLRAGTDRNATVICTQGAVIPRMLGRLARQPDATGWETGKADGWLVPFSGPSPLPPAPLAVRS